MPEEFTHDVFLSHSSKDKAVVRAVAERLRGDGLRVWLDEWEIHPGDSIPAKIEAGLERSRVLVLCMSANAFGSDWAQLEAGTFRFRDPLNKERRFIPLRLDDAPIKGSLAQFRYLNWLTEPQEQEYVKLLEACRENAQFGAANELSTPAPTNSTSSEPNDATTTQSSPRPIGDAWSGVRGLLRQEYSTQIIKDIVGQAGLATAKIEHTGTYKGPYLDEVDKMVASMNSHQRELFVVGCIQEIVAFEENKAANLLKIGGKSDGQTLTKLHRVLSRFGHDLKRFKQA